jgi:hypothetical protein
MSSHDLTQQHITIGMSKQVTNHQHVQLKSLDDTAGKFHTSQPLAGTNSDVLIAHK